MFFPSRSPCRWTHGGPVHLHPGSQLLIAVSDGTADLTDRRSVPDFLKTVPFSSSGVPPVAYQMLGKVPKGGLSQVMTCTGLHHPPNSYCYASYTQTDHLHMVQAATIWWDVFVFAAKEADFQKEKRGKAVPPSCRGHFSGPFCHNHVAPLAVCSWYALPLSTSFAAKECLMWPAIRS
jgi:hypothetical protein